MIRYCTRCLYPDTRPGLHFNTAEAGNYQHLAEALEAGASALAAASIFHFTEQTPREAKRYLRDQGYPVRL